MGCQKEAGEHLFKQEHLLSTIRYMKNRKKMKLKEGKVESGIVQIPVIFIALQ